MIRPRTARDDVALLAARAVEPGHEEAFQEWARGVLAAAATTGGHLGGGLFHPARDGGPWLVVHRFRNQQALRDWLDSPQRAAFFADCDGHSHAEVARRELTGMETWFSDSERSASAPPRWKMAVTAAVGILPISLLSGLYLAPQLTALSRVAQIVVLAPLFSVLMTYVSMPIVTRVVRRWLTSDTATTAPTKENP